MVVPYFIFKNKDSRDFNIIVNELPPIQTVDDEVEYIEVPGRDGHLTITKDRKPSLEKEVVISIRPGSDIANIKKWLSSSGKLILSNDPEVFYIARIQTIRELEEVSKFGSVSLNFMCQPYGYLYSGDETLIIDSKNTILINQYAESKPIVKVVGNGAGDVTINNKKIIIDNIDSSIVIDSELEESYSGTQEAFFKGEYPVFINGENAITWSGGVTRLEVIPRWRK